MRWFPKRLILLAEVNQRNSNKTVIGAGPVMGQRFFVRFLIYLIVMTFYAFLNEFRCSGFLSYPYDGYTIPALSIGISRLISASHFERTP